MVGWTVSAENINLFRETVIWGHESILTQHLFSSLEMQPFQYKTTQQEACWHAY
jgi:hypothetical protein